MSVNFGKVVAFLFEQAWHFMSAWYLPGTNVTPLAMIFFAAAAGLGFRFLGSLLFMGTQVSNKGKSDE